MGVAETAAGIIGEGVCYSHIGWIVANVALTSSLGCKAPAEAFHSSMATGCGWCSVCLR